MKDQSNLYWIDVLRGIAISMVAATHCGILFENIYIRNITIYGQLGVQLFFFVSAITICLSFDNRKEKNKILNFYIRRIFRIAPLYYIGIFVYLLQNSMSIEFTNNFNFDFEISKLYNLKNILANITFIHGFYPPANNTIVPGGWSIGTEMAFYLLFPLLWYMQKKMKWLLFIGSTFLICIIFTFVLINYLGISVNNNEFYFFNIINQLNVFCIGIVYYIINIKYIKYKYTYKLSLVIFIFFTVICILTWKLHLQYSFYYVPIFCAISYWGLVDLVRNKKIYLMKIFSEIGKVSFSIYIFHFIVIHIFSILFFKDLKINTIYESFIIFIFTYILILYISYTIGQISNKFIEKPFINFGKKLISKI